MSLKDYRSSLLTAMALLGVSACSNEDLDTSQLGQSEQSKQSGHASAQPTVKSGSSNERQASGAVAEAGKVTVPAGFTISKFHTGVGDTARHIAVRDNGDVYVAMRDGRIVALRDTDMDGNANGQVDGRAERALDVTTGVEIHNGWLYYSDRVSVSRLLLGDGLMPTGEPEIVISGFTPERQHAEKTFTFDSAGNLYVNIGAPSNACQSEMRTPGSPGLDPCPQLESYAGVWKFPAETIGMDASDGTRYLTGTRNTMAMEWSEANDGFFVATHGRDQLHTLFPELYSEQQSAELPAEELHLIQEGANIGWPYTYYDPAQGNRVLAPEYGGDGVKKPETEFHEPVWTAPAHWAPNDLTLINNAGFPEPFNEGVLIAFHGSWNRAPLSQAGYRVSFVPTSAGQVSGEPVNFAIGFPLKDLIESPSEAAHRPTSVAMGPNGAVYIGDSAQGTIFKVDYDNQR